MKHSLVTQWSLPLVFATLLAGGWVAVDAFQGMGRTTRPVRTGTAVETDLPPIAVDFRDVAEAAGLTAPNVSGGATTKKYILETTGNGIAVFDSNNDGLLDVYVANGTTLDGDGPGATSTGHLYRNLGNMRFEDVTQKAGLARVGWGQGVCVGDYNSDGHRDLFVTHYGQSLLYRNRGDGTFEDATAHAGLRSPGTRWDTGCTFFDYDRDGKLDLAVTNYLEFDRAKVPEAGSSTFCLWKGLPVMCGPRGLPGAPDHLFRNNGDGTFTDTTRQAGVTDAKGLYGFGVAWVDLDDDGRSDLFVANDSGPNYVYRNIGHGRFENISYPSGAALDGDGREQAHMGVAIGDYDNDGRADIHVTNFADDFNVLYHNHGGSSVTDVSFKSGIAQVSIPFLGWGTDFLDYDNDGWLDLLVVNGHVYPAVDTMPWDTSYAQRALLFRNLEGRRFEEIGAAAGDGLSTPRVSRGSAVGDLDNDGGVDVVINNIDGAPTVARNIGGGSAGHWLTVRLVGDPDRKCPRDAIGSVVFVDAGGVRRRGEVASGRGQISQSDLRVHIGLGRETKVSKLDVRWAGGDAATYSIDRVDAVVTIDQKSGRVSYGR